MVEFFEKIYDFVIKYYRFIISDTVSKINDLNTGFKVFWDSICKGAINDILKGLLATLEIAVFGLLIGIVIGTLIAVVRVVPKYKTFPKILDKICTVYVGFFRGTPMTVQLLLGYFVILPSIRIYSNGEFVPLVLDALWVAIIIFGLNSGAYVSEIMRGGINSVDIGQLEAGRALGLSYPKTMLKVVIPQAVKNILPTLGNEFITLIKDTSIVSFIAVVDITKAFRSIADSNYEYIVPYCGLAIVYLVLVALITLLVRLLERKMAKSDRK